MSKKTFLLIATLLLSVWSFSQTDYFNQRIGVSLKASTNGFGGDIYYRPIKQLAIKAGAEYLSINLSPSRIESFINQNPNVAISNPYGDDIVFNTNGKIRTGSLSLSVGYQPFKLFYITAGIGKSLFNTDVTGIATTDIVFETQDVPIVGMVTPKIHKEDIGPFIVDIDNKNSIIPYIGIGLGSYVPQSKKFSFALEIGAYYVGNYVIKYTIPTGLNASNIDYGLNLSPAMEDVFSDYIDTEINRVVTDIDKEVGSVVDDINDALKGYKFYPVLKLTIGFGLFSF
ncbi:MAG: hypothetical protein GX921_07625 [Bacteroidales bacterium]|nr:hypothetical protein [Bacteroidales bacterium]